MTSIEHNSEPKYEIVLQSNEDSEVSEILNNAVETVSENTVEESTVFSAIQDSEKYSSEVSQTPTGPGSCPDYENNTIVQNVLLDNVPNTRSQDNPLEPNRPNTPQSEDIPLLKVTLFELIKKIVSDRELQQKYEFPIDAKYIDCLKQIVETHPKYFGSVESALFVIVKDGRISIADLPEIVQIVLDLYVILYSVHPKDLVDMCAGILKTVFYVALKGRVIVVEHENEIIWAFDSFIDSITELLKTQIQLHGTWNNITRGFGRLFKC
jgi:hypothetical protein